jgi:hypothetical protein
MASVEFRTQCFRIHYSDIQGLSSTNKTVDPIQKHCVELILIKGSVSAIIVSWQENYNSGSYN